MVTLSYWLRGIMPVGFFMAGTLWFGNLVYLYLSVSFIQMLKAFTPVITMCALFLTRLETPTYKVCVCVCLCWSFDDGEERGGREVVWGHALGNVCVAGPSTTASSAADTASGVCADLCLFEGGRG